MGQTDKKKDLKKVTRESPPIHCKLDKNPWHSFGLLNHRLLELSLKIHELNVNWTINLF